MAMSTEELLLQMNILASKTDEATNPNMVYKSTATLNKGLNPEYFTGQNTKIVNAINKLASDVALNAIVSNDVADKVNEILKDTTDLEGAALWEETKELMGADTIIEGINKLLKGNSQQQLLGITEEDLGKILSVAKDEDGNLITKAIDMPTSDTPGIVGPIEANEVNYSHHNHPELSTVGLAIDYLLENQGTGNAPSGSVYWDSIIDKPEFASRLEMTATQLILRSDEDEIMSSVNLTTDSDIEDMIDSLL